MFHLLSFARSHNSQWLVLCVSLAVALPLAAHAGEESAELLTLIGLEEAALALDPQAQTFLLAQERHEALRRQAGMRPNAGIELELEEFGGTGDLTGLQGLSTTLRYSMELEPGARRTSAQSLLHAESSLIALDAETRQRAIRLLVGEQFVLVLQAQARLDLAAHRVELAQETQGVVEVRVEAGRAAPLEATRSRIDLAQAESVVAGAQYELESAVKQLAQRTGLPHLSADALALDVAHIPAPPSLDTLRLALASHPDVRRWEMERARREAAIAVERAVGLPERSWSAGIQQFQESDDWALTAGMSWEWPRRNRNRDGIHAAELEFAQVDSELATVQHALDLELETAWHALDRSYRELERLDRSVEPLASEVLALTQEAYRVGKVGLVDALDAQRALIDVQEHLLEAREDYHEAALALRALTGWNVFDVSAGGLP